VHSSPHHSEQEKVLLQQVAAGEEQAFRQLFELRREKVYSFAWYLTRSDIMAEEITQEIFLKIWINRRQLTDIMYFNAWLKTIVRNLSYTWLKRMALESQILHHIEKHQPEATAETEDPILLREFHRVLREAINQLPPRQKEIFLLSRREHLPHAVIAEQLDISVNTVKNHMKAALRTIRHYLERHAMGLAPAMIVLADLH
jgi:RNA polymerase sigma-70 factor (family 1)